MLKTAGLVDRQHVSTVSKILIKLYERLTSSHVEQTFTTGLDADMQIRQSSRNPNVKQLIPQSGPIDSI